MSASKGLRAKVHAVEMFGKTHLVMARTKQGAARDLVEHLRDTAHVQIATGEQIYMAAREGAEIIGLDRYKAQTDPNQLPLDGVPETADDSPF